MSIQELIDFLMRCNPACSVVLKVTDDFGTFVMSLHESDLKIEAGILILDVAP